MNLCRWGAVAALLTLTLGVGSFAPSQPPTQPITLKVVKYPELAKTVAGLKGKVVLIDMWSTT